MKLKDRIAVITGGGRGIGRAIALAFAREGAKLVLMARSANQLEQVCQEVKSIGGESFAVMGDISKKADIENLVTKTLEWFGPPDIVVNNASITKRSLLVESDDNVWAEVIQTNLVGNYLMTKHFLKRWWPERRGGLSTLPLLPEKQVIPLTVPMQPPSTACSV